MGGSGQSQDYRPEVDKALAQANTPKSDLAQQLSALFGGMLNGVGGAGAGNNPLYTPGQAMQGNTGKPAGVIPNLGGQVGTPISTTPIDSITNPGNSQGLNPNLNSPATAGLNNSQSQNPTNPFGNGGQINPFSIFNLPHLTDPNVGDAQMQGGGFAPSGNNNSNIITDNPGFIPGLLPGADPNAPSGNSSLWGQHTGQDPKSYNANNNPFSNLANMVGQSQTQQLYNAGNYNPALTDQLGMAPQFNPQTRNTSGYTSNPLQNLNLQNNIPQGYGPQTQNAQTATSNNVNGINTNIDPSQAQRLGLNLSGPQTQFQDYGSQINQQLGNFNPHQADLSSVNTNINSGTPLGTDTNSDYSNAVQSILAQKQNKDIADLRARFGALGGTSQGTPAQYAEAELRAQQAPQIAAALGQIRQQESGIDLANRQLGVQAQTASGQLGLDSRGQDLNNYQNTQGNILQSLGLGVQNASNLGNLNLGQNQLNSQNQLQTQGLNSQNAQSLLGLQNQFNNTGINQNAQQLQNQQFNAGQINSSGLQNRGLTLQDILQQQQYGLGRGNLQNQTNSLGLQQNAQTLQNQQYNAGQLNGLGTQNRALTLQDLQQQQQYGLGAAGINSQNAQFNAGQTNQLNQNYQQQQQAAQEAMLGRNANASNQLAAYIAALAGAGIPGGSANVNVSPIQNGGGSGWGGTLQGLGSLAQAAAAFR